MLIPESKNIPYDHSDVDICLIADKKIYSGRSKFQKIEVYHTNELGNVLMLDGIFQTSEGDEFVYHEMIVHLPMYYHKNPKKVLIVGGGDGGSLEEVLKHNIDRVWMVDIDKKVIDISRKYLPSISKKAFDSRKAEIVIGDGMDFVSRYNNFFDVIILDLSDPWGPAAKMFSVSFFRNVKRALKGGGVISVQSGSLACQLELTKLIYTRLKKVFKSVKVHKATVKLYGVGDFSFTVASDLSLNKFRRSKLKTRYYSPEMHLSSGVLPPYLKKEFK